MNPRNIVIGIVALAIIGVGGFYAWTHYGPGAGTVSIDGLPAPIDTPLAQVQEGDMVSVSPRKARVFLEVADDPAAMI